MGRWEYTFVSRVLTQSKNYWLLPRTRTAFITKEESTNTDVTNQGVL